jgi:hypothetical protein
MDRDEMVMNIHLHLSRADGERPELVKITNGNWLEEKYLRERNFEKVKMYMAYTCLWKHPSGACFEFRIAERLIKKCLEYADQVRAFEANVM